MPIRDDINRGDWIEVEWFDIRCDPVGNPDLATIQSTPNRHYRPTSGRFWERKTVEVIDSHKCAHSVPVLVTTNTIDPDGPEQQGWDVYPESVVLRVNIIRRYRQAQKRKEKSNASRAAKEPTRVLGSS